VKGDEQIRKRNENARKRYARQSVEQIAKRISRQKTNRRARRDASSRKGNELEGNNGGTGAIEEEGQRERMR
jgi:hypothetical protein